ncbi:MAG: imidazole glycerol phosphate synthase subunit HisH [Candidatus Bathyarchaeia archaeon]
MGAARKPTIAVVSYGVGNLWSITNGFRQVGAAPRLVKHLKDLPRFDAAVLPGVGAFRSAIAFLREQHRYIEDAAAHGQPILGICLGMQLLFEESEEGGLTPGLGLIRGRVKRLPKTVKIPHMGWNQVSLMRRDPFLEGVQTGDYFYFVHSYSPTPQEPEVILAATEHGVSFPSVVAKGSVYGTQFHPEKSGEKGLRLLKNFVQIAQEAAD